MPRIDWSKPLSAKEILEMSPQRRWYLLHREEIRLKRLKHYQENRDSILESARARAEMRRQVKAAAIKTELESKDADEIHSEPSPILPSEPGDHSSTGAGLLCGKCGGPLN